MPEPRRRLPARPSTPERMIVITAGGLLTMVQRDSRESLGDFVLRAWETHAARMGPAGGGCFPPGPGAQNAPEATSEASPASITAAARRRVYARLGCSYDIGVFPRDPEGRDV